MHIITSKLPQFKSFLVRELLSDCSSCFAKRYAGSQRSAMNVFDRHMKRLQRNRTQASLEKAPQVYDYIRNEVAYQIYDRFNDIDRKFKVLVDLGCHRSQLSKLITADQCEVIYECDMAEELLCSDRSEDVSPEGIRHTYKVICDEEFVPFARDTIDICLSNLSLHWVNDLPSSFKQICDMLRQDGAFIGSMFGGQTLYQLRAALQLAELDREGGFGPHISPFIEAADLGDLLAKAGFTLITLDVDDITVNYPSMFELMYDLKGMGENACSWNRKPSLHRDSLLAASGVYKELYGNDDGSVPATFQVYYMIGWKPHPSQVAAAKRGSAEVSMKDLDKIDTLIDQHTRGNGKPN